MQSGSNAVQRAAVDHPAVDLTAVRDDFPMLDRLVHGQPLAYLDNAATTLKPRSVIQAVADHYQEEVANIHRGVHYLSQLATERYEATRERVRDLLGAREPEEIIFTSGTTAAINLVAQSWGDANLAEGDEIVVTEMEHHSNIVPWQMACRRRGCVLRVLPILDDGSLDLEAVQRVLSPRTRLLAVTLASNALGTVVPVPTLAAAARQRGAVVLVDAAQAVAHAPIDVHALDCDFLAFSGHKLYGPTGVGVLYGRRELLEEMPPVAGGGDMIRSVAFEGSTYAELPNRLEAGTPNIAGVIGLGAAIDYMQGLGFDWIGTRERRLLHAATEALQAIDTVRVIGTAADKAPVLSFVVGDIHPHDLGTIADGEGVAIRTGHHCAQPVMQRFGLPATARASFAFYNTEAEIGALTRAIHRTMEVFA